MVVAQLKGADPLVNKLAAPAIQRHKYPVLEGKDNFEDRIRTLIAAELAEKVRPSETIEKPATARVNGPLATD